MRSWVLLVGALALGCGGGDDGGTGGAGAGAGGLGGFGGAGSGGTTAGTGGVAGSAGTGGMAGTTAGTGGMAGSGEPLAPTFTNIVTTILPNCAGPTCHSSVAGGNLMLVGDKAAVHAALVGVDAMGVNLPPDPTKMNCKDTGLKRVVAGNPEMSLLYLKVQTAMDPPCGLRMPTGGMLTADKVELIRAWIAAGANND